MLAPFDIQIALCLSLLISPILLHAHNVPYPPTRHLNTAQHPAEADQQLNYHFTPTQDPLLPNTHHDKLFAEDAPFLGLSTYANLPYVHCLSMEREVERYDIAILGAPFDTVSVVPAAWVLRRDDMRITPKGIEILLKHKTIMGCISAFSHVHRDDTISETNH